MRMSKTILQSKYLKADDLNGQSRRVLVSHIDLVTMGLPGEEEEKHVLFLHDEPKGLVLNKTNARSLADLLGDESDNWAGKAITLYPAEASFRGKPHTVIRIREAAQADADTPF
jgi:hypothetical protein